MAEKDSAVKKRKGHRPCDMCRLKKRDGEEPCSNCVQHDFICTYQQRAMQRTTSASSSYVQSLESRLKSVESLLRESNIVPIAGSSASRKGPGVELITYAIRNLTNPLPPPHSDDLSFVEVAQSLRSLSLNNPGDHGFQGKSSQAMLVKAAVDLKTTPSESAIPTPPCVKPWRLKPWEDAPPRRTYTFPEDDLMTTLISLYFVNINVFFPLLHRPMFETAVAGHTHLQDDGFASTLLLVCTLGALYTDDPRVHVPNVSACGTAGWKWFDQVQLAGHPLCGQPTVYDLQCYCLAIQFLDRTSGGRACWTLVGFGIRLGQDIGAHRRKTRTRTVSAEEELEKRAYWLLILFDSHFSGALGRSIAIQSHDFDLELPVSCDDEYWEASAHNAAFSQPPNIPSPVDFFVCQLNLNRIRSFTLKILYSTNRSKSMIGMNDEGWEEKVVVELDSALNMWFDSVPAHLRWDPTCPNDVFFDQSAALYCSYYLVQILVHRPLIPAIRHSANPSTFPSLSICTSAARACSHVAEIQQRRRPHNPLMFGQTAVFTAGIVLLLNIWGGNRSEDADLSDVYRCTGVLRAHKEHWPSAGPQLDTLEQLLKMHSAPPARPASEVHDPSPFVSSGICSGAHASGDTHGPPVAWKVYRAVDPEFLDYVDGPGEAPARAPHVPVDYSPAVSGSTVPAPHAFTDTQYFDAEQFGVPNGQHADMDKNMNPDTVTLWSTAPTAFEVSDWDLYLNNLADMLRTDQSAAM
ncbi:fungal-specific transcription factor domain-containing protein [Mycena vulgaris]|nr:fungal-specific transcription factor domain-containing protein [Mycena vulgaris]